MIVKCFLIQPAGFWIEACASWDGCSADPFGGHRHYARELLYEGLEDPRLDVRSVAIDRIFPAVCEYCGQPGGQQRATSSGSGRFWLRPDTGERHRHIADFGPGAMWFADWYRREESAPGAPSLYGWDWDNQFTPPLMVRTPSGGDWNIDSRCSNCTLPNDRLHRCWIRRGDPPGITVDKAGLTCSAGAGSIISGNYHGFLRNGEFVS